MFDAGRHVRRWRRSWLAPAAVFSRSCERSPREHYNLLNIRTVWNVAGHDYQVPWNNSLAFGACGSGAAHTFAPLTTTLTNQRAGGDIIQAAGETVRRGLAPTDHDGSDDPTEIGEDTDQRHCPATAAPLTNSGGTVRNIGRAMPMPMPIAASVTAIKARAEWR
jgi:hypothetical protein